MRACIICKRRLTYLRDERPVCRKCERDCPVAVSSPALFTIGPASLAAAAAVRASRQTEEATP